MALTLAFDVYGTLIDTAGVERSLAPLVGDDLAGPVSQSWRSKQLEYAFRRGLMRRYQPFSDCTRQALAFALQQHGQALSAAQQDSLLQAYRRLPAFPDAVTALAALRTRGHRLWAFSNGESDAVAELLGAAGLSDAFDGIVSVEDVASFKPDPAVYAHFLNRAQARADTSWLISSNPFDVLGARSAGWQAAWVQRSAAQPFDPWELQPSLTVPDLNALSRALAS